MREAMALSPAGGAASACAPILCLASLVTGWRRQCPWPCPPPWPWRWSHHGRLIHGDPSRHGTRRPAAAARPTITRVFGEANAILAGDALLPAPSKMVARPQPGGAGRAAC